MLKRKNNEINLISMSDIAFLLLIFFLFTTSFNEEKGIAKMLPILVCGPKHEIKHRNKFIIAINDDNQIIINNKLKIVSEIKELCTEFFINPKNNEYLSENELFIILLEKELEKDNVNNFYKNKISLYKSIIKTFGQQTYKSNGVVILIYDNKTNYGNYIEVFDQVLAALNELRNRLSQKTLGKNYDKLTKQQQRLVREVYPHIISEAEPYRYHY